jgi:hypothetical protein
MNRFIPKDYGGFEALSVMERTGYLGALLNEYAGICDGRFPGWDENDLRNFLNAVAENDQKDRIKRKAERMLLKMEKYVEKRHS